jgi:ribosomal protein S18 acetylase RimI-like enzyme
VTDVRVATAADHRVVVDDLLEAFMDDPVLCWVFPDSDRRRRYGRHFFELTARRLLPGGLAWRADGGAALWAAPGRWRESFPQSLRLSIATFPGIRRRSPRVARGLLALEARHPQEPHLYLPTIGVRPDRQGRGLGSALLRPGLQYADAAGLPAYLESSSPRNVALYERHGFAVTAEHTLPGGPALGIPCPSGTR